MVTKKEKRIQPVAEYVLLQAAQVNLAMVTQADVRESKNTEDVYLIQGMGKHLEEKA